MPQNLGTDKTPRLPSHPTSPVAGQRYFNTTDNFYKYYNGHEWLNIGNIQSFAPLTWDYADLTYNDDDLLSNVVYREGGSSGTITSNLTIDYTYEYTGNELVGETYSFTKDGATTSFEVDLVSGNITTIQES